VISGDSLRTGGFRRDSLGFDLTQADDVGRQLDNEQGRQVPGERGEGANPLRIRELAVT
jgi:hypothetical protein